MTTKTRTATAIALALALLAGGAANALPRDGRITPAAQEAGLFAPLWSWLAGLFAPGGLMAAWGEAGGMMDPNGLAVDEGPIMDPDGQYSDAGGEMDPNGVPLGSMAPSDEGPIMDPDG